MEIMKVTTKKAVLIVVLDTAYAEARRVAVQKDCDVGLLAPNYEVRQAFASRDLIEELAERDGIVVEDEKQALQRLEKDGFTEIIVQPFQIADGEEYERVLELVGDYGARKSCDRIEPLPCLTVRAKPLECVVN
jgi:cobalamin biosynthesis Co2+ chelatase CbiK